MLDRLFWRQAHFGCERVVHYASPVGASRGFVMSGTVAISRSPVLALLASLCAALAMLALGSASTLASPATYLHSFGPFERPTGVAVEESSGNVFVPESGEDFDAVKVFGERGGSPAGGAPPAFSGTETPAKRFAFDMEWAGVAVDNSNSPAGGSVYIADRGHGVVDRFKLSSEEYKYESQLTGSHPNRRRSDRCERRRLRQRSRRQYRPRVLARGHKEIA